MLGSSLLLVSEIRWRAGLVEFAELRASMAGSGGVIFVRNPEDCAATAGPVEFTAAALQARGVVVQGVILERGPVDVAVQLASEAFPHTTLSLRAASTLAALGHSRTPLAVIVDSSGAVVKVEALAGRSWQAVLGSLGPM